AAPGREESEQVLLTTPGPRARIMRSMRRLLSLLAAASLLVGLAALDLAGAPPAGALNAITTFTAPNMGGPDSVTTGPDGNIWFASSNGDKIGKVTPSGGVTVFPQDPLYGPNDIVAGPDGNLWFTARQASGLGRITPTGTV